MKDYPTYTLKNYLMITATESFDKSLEIEKKMKANGATGEEIQKAIKFQNPYDVYVTTSDEILGDTYTEYWTKLLGEMPKSNWFDRGIIEIGDIVINALNDPKSYKFHKFTVDVGKYAGQPAWRVDYWYRAKNAFGALILTHHYFYVRHGKVIGMEEPKD